jgi:arginine decarboxylase
LYIVSVKQICISIMQIIITSGTGEGPTSVAAFDAALINAGVSNYNLLYLSSIIPGGSILKRARFVSPKTEYGHRLYVVIARHDETREGHAAWAGLGWTQENETGRGLFVELHGSDKAEVEKAIHDTLKAMSANRSIPCGAFETELADIPCRGNPVCAVAVAVYRSEAWV